jgi:N6-adenosine-specific RNA methylase IME4
MNDLLSAESAVTDARSAWAGSIAARWGASVAAIIDTGKLLVEAKAALPHGEWGAMIERDLPFKRSTAFRLMAIARDERLRMVPAGQHLPPSWRTLYEISKLDDERFQAKLRNGEIRSDMLRRDVANENRLLARARDEARVLRLEPVPGRFRTLVHDPAWEYDWLSLAARARPGYAMQTREQLRALNVKAWSDEAAGCHLYLWTPNNFMARACGLIAHWGFEHRGVITWIKPPPFGQGDYFRNSTEQVLFATLGDTTTRPAAASLPTHFEAPRGEHSEKPEKFYDIVRAASYPPYGEGNQRQPRPDFVNLFRERRDA